MGKIMKEGIQYGVGSGDRLIRTVVSDTTSSAGLITTTIPYEKLISVAIATTGVNYYCNARQAGSGMAAVLVWDYQFQVVANTAVSVAVIHKE